MLFKYERSDPVNPLLIETFQLYFDPRNSRQNLCDLVLEFILELSGFLNLNN